MLRFLLRMIGFVLLAAAFAAVIVDGTRSVAARQVMMFSVGETTGWLLPAPMAALIASADRAPPFLRSVLNGALALPACLVIALSAVLCLVAGRVRRDPIGVSDPR